jgi:hypothetical protein
VVLELQAIETQPTAMTKKKKKAVMSDGQQEEG